MGLFDRLKKAFKKDHDKEEIKSTSGEEIETSSAKDVEPEASDAKKEEQEIVTEVETKDKIEDKDISETKAEVTLNEDVEPVQPTVKIDSSTDEFDIEPEVIVFEESKETDEESNLTKEETTLEQEVVEEMSEVENSKEVQEEIIEKETTSTYEKGLEKTRKTFGERLNELFANFRRVDENFFEDLEETLILSDVGFETAVRLTDELRQEVKLKNAKKPQEIQNTIIEKLVDIYEEAGLNKASEELNIKQDGLTIILFVGVNGAGKTTTIGKLANQFKVDNKKVILAAADTFRAGAINQLVKWGERSGVEVVHGKEGGDPAAVVYDAVHKAKEEQADVLLVDTAGRLQNKEHLMRELNKIKRVIQKEEPNAPQEVLLVVDATTGQNALVQAQKFNETTELTGLVLTKLDGTAKGGIILAIRNELKIPVKLVGLGEGINDLAKFDSEQFAYSLFKDLWNE